MYVTSFLVFHTKVTVNIGLKSYWGSFEARKQLNNRHKSDLIHYQTGNALSHASGPVHPTHSPVTCTYLKPYGCYLCVCLTVCSLFSPGLFAHFWHPFSYSFETKRGFFTGFETGYKLVLSPQ